MALWKSRRAYVARWMKGDDDYAINERINETTRNHEHGATGAQQMRDGFSTTGVAAQLQIGREDCSQSGG
jgi:hypothetical protein